MIYTFKGLYDQVLRSLADQSDTGNIKDLAKDYVNQAQQLRLAEYPWPFMLWDTAETFSTVSTTSSYALHSEFARPLYFYNRNTDRYLREIPLRQIAPEGHNSEATDSDAFSLTGRTPVQYQPTSASVITLSSSSASDTGSTYNVVIKGVTAAGRVEAEIVTPSGTTGVATSSSFTKILGVSKAAEWNGTLTLTSNSAAVTNLTLGATEMGRSFPLLQFHGTPTGSHTIEYKFYRQPLILVNDYDIPELPAPFSQLLVWDALLMFSAYNAEIQSSPLWTAQQKRWEDALHKAHAEAQSLGAGPQFVRDLSDLADYAPDRY